MQPTSRVSDVGHLHQTPSTDSSCDAFHLMSVRQRSLEKVGQIIYAKGGITACSRWSGITSTTFPFGHSLIAYTTGQCRRGNRDLAKSTRPTNIALQERLLKIGRDRTTGDSLFCHSFFIPPFCYETKRQ